MRFFRDLGWWLRARRRVVGNIDGMRMGADRRLVEIVVPRWWDLRRWWVWAYGCEEVLESSFGAKGGGFAFLMVRVRGVPPPVPQGIRLPDGRVIVPKEPSGITKR